MKDEELWGIKLNEIASFLYFFMTREINDGHSASFYFFCKSDVKFVEFYPKNSRILIKKIESMINSAPNALLV